MVWFLSRTGQEGRQGDRSGGPGRPRQRPGRAPNASPDTTRDRRSRWVSASVTNRRWWVPCRYASRGPARWTGWWS